MVHGVAKEMAERGQQRLEGAPVQAELLTAHLEGGAPAETTGAVGHDPVQGGGDQREGDETDPRDPPVETLRSAAQPSEDEIVMGWMGGRTARSGVSRGEDGFQLNDLGQQAVQLPGGNADAGREAGVGLLAGIR